MSIYFYGDTYRLLGVVIASAAIVMSYQDFYATMNLSYAPGLKSTRESGFLNTILVDGEYLVFVGAVIGAMCGIAFVGLQFKKMRVSRHELVCALVKQKKKTKELENTRKLLMKQKESLDAVVDELDRVSEAIKVTRSYSVVEAAVISQELVWSLGSSNPDNIMHKSASICQLELTIKDPSFKSSEKLRNFISKINLLVRKRSRCSDFPTFAFRSIGK